MSTKPSAGQLPTFDTALTNTTAITGGHQTSGFANNEIPTAAEINTLFAFLYLWCKYLSDGAFQGAASFDTTITMGANQNIVLSGTGAYKRGTRTRHIGGAALILTSTPSAGILYYNGGIAMQMRAVGNTASVNLALEDGEQLQSVTAYVQCGGTDVLTMKVQKDAHGTAGGTGVDTQLGATQTSAAHTNIMELLTVSGLTENVSVAGTSYRVDIACTAFGANPFIYGVDYTTTIP